MNKQYNIVSVRLNKDRYKRLDELIHTLGKTWPWAFDYGLTNVEEKSEDFLRERLLQLQKDALQCNSKMLENQYFALHCNTEIEELRQLYVSQGRNITNPSHEDSSWLKARLRKLEDTMTPKEFLNYCQVKQKDGIIVEAES